MPNQKFPAVAEIQAVFFAAMLDGYVGGNPFRKSQLRRSPYSNYTEIEITYSDGPYEVIDKFRTMGEWAFGSTTIMWNGRPVWVMQYRGTYEDAVLQFLKKVLAEQYRKGVFYGGRGPEQFESNGLVYSNSPFVAAKPHMSIDSFDGFETVFRRMCVYGWHSYAGGLLFVPDSVQF